MKSIKIVFFFSLLFLLFSCADETIETPEVIDNEGPEIYQSTWIDHPSVYNDPTGPISDGGNYVISIQDGFQFLLSVRDASDIIDATIYFQVNDDPEIRETVSYGGSSVGFKDKSYGFIHRVSHISLGQGIFYDLKEGDRFHFYANFIDELDNETKLSWTADLVE